MEKISDLMGDEAFGLMLIWKQRIAHKLTKEAQEQDPTDAVYVGNLLIGLRKLSNQYGWDLDELIEASLRQTVSNVGFKIRID
tara:strand:+ start:386 stop:634 length:249 start_codon:yes stop_codon:yes gene_type:complete